MYRLLDEDYYSKMYNIQQNEELRYLLGNKRTKYKNSSFRYIILALMITIIFLLCIMISVTKTRNKNYYLATIVEYSHIPGGTPRESMIRNVANFEKIIETASKQGADIILFPEHAITGDLSSFGRNVVRKYVSQIPAPDKQETPYLQENYNQILSRLSEAAKIHHIYLVVSLPEIEFCPVEDTDCPPDRGYHFITNIVFDRNGSLIARCRKFNTLCELPGFDHPKEGANISVFTTDFDVTFGNVCFDILSGEPNFRNIRKTNISDIILSSSASISEIPLYIAFDIRSMLSYSLNMNILTSNNIGTATSKDRSSFYTRSIDSMEFIVFEFESSKLLITKVPKKQPKQFEFPMKFGSYLNPKNTPIWYKSNTDDVDADLWKENRYQRKMEVKLLENSTESITDDYLEYRNNGFSCNIYIKYQNNRCQRNTDCYHYRLYGYAGKIGSVSCADDNAEICGVSLCADINKKHCIPPPEHLKSNILISSVTIFTTSNSSEGISLPFAMDQNMYPLEKSNVSFSRDIRYITNRSNVWLSTFHLLYPTTNLLTFGIYKFQ